MAEGSGLRRNPPTLQEHTMATEIPDKLYFKIGEVCKITNVEPYILRYWESEFKLIKPYRTKSNQRLYRKKDVEAVLKIRKMLYDQKFTIAGAKKKLKETIPQQKALQQKQLSLNLPDKRYTTAIKDIASELTQLSNMLHKNTL
jgi:DNA-binding transcriptional MerR regulator